MTANIKNKGCKMTDFRAKRISENGVYKVVVYRLLDPTGPMADWNLEPMAEFASWAEASEYAEELERLNK